MGRSVSVSNSVPDATVYHKRSNRYYSVRAGRMRRHQNDAQGREVNVVEKTIDFGIGSGNHAVTYIHRSADGRLTELPVSFYALYGWAMSPGYDKPDHLDFRREVDPACLFCHSDSGEPSPIGCGRCHGDGAAHASKPTRGNIVNPKRLPASRQLDICLQCHLETASSGFPDSLRHAGRDVWSFRPGEALTSYKAYFDRDDGTGAGNDRFEVNHAGYRLMQSRCFTESAGRMTCTTCHDPHTAKARNACASCHASPHANEATPCAACHMPKRAAEDAIHVRMTDHKIVRAPKFEEPNRKGHDLFSGRLKLFYGSGLLELAQVRQTIDSGRGSEESYRRWVDLEPGSVPALAALGEALMRFGKRTEAVRLLEKARAAGPRNVAVLNALAIHHATEGRLPKAMELLEQARAAKPDHPLTWINLGVTHEAMGSADKARSAYLEAVRLQPDSSEARRRLAALQ